MRKLASVRAAVVAAATAATVGLGGIALAASGTLPGAADQHARDALTRTAATPTATETSDADGPDATATPAPTETSSEAADAGEADSTPTPAAVSPSDRPTDTHGYEVSELAKSTTFTGRAKGEAVSELASRDRARAHARPRVTPCPETPEPSDTPQAGDATPSDTAPAGDRTGSTDGEHADSAHTGGTWH